MAVRLEGVIAPLPRMQFAMGTGYYGFCWGLVEDYGSRPTTPKNRQLPNPTAKAKKRKFRGLRKLKKYGHTLK